MNLTDSQMGIIGLLTLFIVAEIGYTVREYYRNKKDVPSKS